ncbi:hypothetical protein QM012_006940 [Aureobasidium pullulans]|uniref:Uncharacterized protein n=1 Tax=Aureobasidium pullulans TaxID=5580 RepID=A0ABR0TRN9_AURPU
MRPTSNDVEAIRRVIGPVKTRSRIGGQFEAALLFFLPKSNIRFEQGALLIGWVHEDDGSKLELWFKLAARDKGGLYLLPAGSSWSRYYPGGDICDEWHPDILNIVGWDHNANRLLQYAYLRSCVKILEATVPPPSIEDSRPSNNNSAHTNSNMVYLTGLDDGVGIKSEEIPTAVEDTQLLDASVVEKFQAFREKLENKQVDELKQSLEKRSQLPSWILDLAKEVLRKKMLQELELAESLLL